MSEQFQTALKASQKAIELKAHNKVENLNNKIFTYGKGDESSSLQGINPLFMNMFTALDSEHKKALLEFIKSN